MKATPQSILASLLIVCAAPSLALASPGDLAGPTDPSIPLGPEESPSGDPAPSEELITKVYQFSEIVVKSPAVFDGITLLPLAKSHVGDENHETYEALEPIVNLFSNTYWKELEFEGRWLEFESNGQVSLRGTQEMHDNFAAMAAWAIRRLEAAIPMQVDIVRFGGDKAPENLLEIASANLWIQRHRDQGRVQTLLFSIPAGAMGSYQQQAVQAIHGKTDVEIAQGVGMAYSIPVEYRSGAWGAMLANPVQGGLELDLQWMLSDAPRVREHKLDLLALVAGEQGSLESMKLGGVVELTDQRAFAAGTAVFLPDGHAYISHFHDPIGGQRVAFVVRRRKAAQPPAWFQTTGKTQSKIFATSAARFENRRFHWNFNEFDHRVPAGYSMDDGRGSVSLERGSRDTGERLASDRNEHLVEVWTELEQLMLRTNSYEESPFDVQVAEIERLARRLQQLAPPQENFQVQIALQGADGVLVQQSHVVQSGHSLQVLQANEHSELHTQEVQIAQGAGMCFPATRLQLEGLVAQLQVMRVSEDEIRIQLGGAFQWPAGDRTVDLDTPWHSSYSVRDYRRMELSESRLLQRKEGGAWEASGGGEGAHLVRWKIRVQEL